MRLLVNVMLPFVVLAKISLRDNRSISRKKTMTLTDIVFVTKNMGLEVFPFVFPFSVGRGMMAQRKETVRAQPHFVGLLTDTFSHIFAIWQRSISAFSPSHDSFSNDRFSSHTALNSVWRWCFVNTATKETAACFGIRSPRVRDSHPIPLSSIEQECVSRRSWLRCECFACPALGRAFATKAGFILNFTGRCMPLCPCRTQEPFPSKNYLL